MRRTRARRGCDVEAEHWIGFVYFALALFDFPDFVFGTAAEGVDRVEVVLSNQKRLGTALLEGPEELSVPLDFYVLELPRGVSVESLVARDRSGTVLERRRMLSRPAHPATADR